MTSTCPNCSSTESATCFESLGVPTYVNFLSKTRDEALACPRGDIVLKACRVCGLITNSAFDPALLTYRAGYENSLHYSSVFQQYAEALADQLISRFDLRGKTVVEIGCGRGDFLYMLCERGDNFGVGYDPSHTEPPDNPAVAVRVRFERELYSEAHADQAADFVCSRHTLEHVLNPHDMLGPLRRALKSRPRTPVFFEVPNAGYTLEHLFLWDIIYEHTSYFTAESLADVFKRAGFEVDRTFEAFGGQYLCVEARAAGSAGAIATETPAPVLSRIDDFSRRQADYLSDWRARLDTLQDARVVLWGGGSKAVTFLNLFELGGRIEYVVDLNPRKHGMYIAGAGQEIVPPEHLRSYRPDVVIVVNPLYDREIRDAVATLDLTPDFLLL